MRVHRSTFIAMLGMGITNKLANYKHKVRLAAADCSIQVILQLISACVLSSMVQC